MNKYDCLSKINDCTHWHINPPKLLLCLCVLSYSSFLYTCVCVSLHIQSPLRECCSIWSGTSGLPYYCAPLVCVSDVMELLGVWRHNKPKTKNQRECNGGRSGCWADAAEWTGFSIVEVLFIHILCSRRKILAVPHMSSAPRREGHIVGRELNWRRAPQTAQWRDVRKRSQSPCSSMVHTVFRTPGQVQFLNITGGHLGNNVVNPTY